MSDPFSDQLVIKMQPELRHALAHIWYAVEALAHGRNVSALAELRSIESLVFFDGDDSDYEAWLKARLREAHMAGKKKNCKDKKNCKGKKK